MFTGHLLIASDHGGYQLKKRLVRYCENELNIKIEDLGPHEHNPADDYPDFVVPLAHKVVETHGRGIVICRNGIGVCIAVNKIAGIKCGIGYNSAVAESMMQHDNTNVLALAADHLSEDHAILVLKKWLGTEFSGDERHVRRLNKIEALEECDTTCDADLQKKCEPTKHAKLQNDNTKLIYPELSYTINGILFKVKKELDENVNEKQACDKIEFYLKKENIPYEREFILPSSFSGETKGRNRIDFIIDNKIIIETKSKRYLTQEDYHQIQRYLHALNKKLGILVNFRDKRINPKRILNSDAKE